MNEERIKLVYLNKIDETSFAYHYKVDNDYYTIIVDKDSVVFNCKHDNDVSDFKTYLNNSYPLFELKDATSQDMNGFKNYYSHIEDDIEYEEFIDLNEYDKKTRFVSKRYVCKRCGSKHIVDVLYGLPTHDATKDTKRGRYVFFGCIIPEETVSHICTDCGFKW